MGPDDGCSVDKMGVCPASVKSSSPTSPHMGPRGLRKGLDAPHRTLPFTLHSQSVLSPQDTWWERVMQAIVHWILCPIAVIVCQVGNGGGHRGSGRELEQGRGFSQDP